MNSEIGEATSDLTSINTERQSALDAIPTSSTDANTTFVKSVTSETAFEDPISSTSSEVCTSQNEYLDEDGDSFGRELSASDINLIIMGQSSTSHNKEMESTETEEEFLNLNITSASDTITEDVEDIVHDLENLLDESVDSCKITSRSTESSKAKQEYFSSSNDFLEKSSNQPSGSSKTALYKTDEIVSYELVSKEKRQDKPKQQDELNLLSKKESQVQVTNEELQTVLNYEEDSDTIKSDVEDKPQKLAPESPLEEQDSDMADISDELQISEPMKPEETATNEDAIRSNESNLTTPAPKKTPQRVRLIRSPVRSVEILSRKVEAKSDPQAGQLPANSEEPVVKSSSTEHVQEEKKAEHVTGKVEEPKTFTDVAEQVETSCAEAVPLEETQMQTEIIESDNLIRLQDQDVPSPPDQKESNIEELCESSVPIENSICTEMDQSSIPTSKEIVLDAPKTVEVLDEIETVETLDEPKNDEILDESKTGEILDESKTVEVLDEPKTVETLDEPKTVQILDEPKTVQILEETKTVYASDEPKTVDELDEPEKVEEEIMVGSVQQMAEPEKVEEETVVDTVQHVSTNEDIEMETVEAFSSNATDDTDIANESEVPVVKSTVDNVCSKISELQVICESDSIADQNIPTPLQTEKLDDGSCVLQDDNEDSSVVECPTDAEAASDSHKIDIPSADSAVHSSLLKDVDINLQTTLTVDVSDEELQNQTETISQSSEQVQHHDIKTSSEGSKNLLKITITKQSVGSHSILKIYNPDESQESPKSQFEQTERVTRSPRKLSPVVQTEKVSPEVGASSKSPTVDSFTSKVSAHFSPTVPKLTIKPIIKPDTTSPLKLTIKPVLKPEETTESKSKLSLRNVVKIGESSEMEHAKVSPKIIIKPLIRPEESGLEKETHKHKYSPKLTIKPIVKPDESAAYSEEHVAQKSSPKLIIKPVVKPDETGEEYKIQKVCPKLTIKPIIKPDEVIDAEHVVHSPRITIKPVLKPDEVIEAEHLVHSPRITIKPIVKPEEQRHSPKIIIKPIVKPEAETGRSSPRVIIKPIEIPDESDSENMSTDELSDSPKVVIKPLPKPAEATELVDFEDEIKQERIILKINKNTMRKRDHAEDVDKSEKLAKIKVKYSKEGGHARIVPQRPVDNTRHYMADNEMAFRKRFKLDDLNIPQGVTITNVEPGTSKPKDTWHQEMQESLYHGVNIEPIHLPSYSIENCDKSSKQSTTGSDEVSDPLADIPVFEITPESAAVMRVCNSNTTSTMSGSTTNIPTPRKRGRPRKVPLEVREEFNDVKEEEEEPIEPKRESDRPKRSCRGQSVKTTLGIKPRKPRGPGRGRGGSRGTGSRAAKKLAKESKLPGANLNLPKENTLDSFVEQTSNKECELKVVSVKLSTVLPVSTEIASTDVAIYEEETRMSADTSSRAQTPAKQVSACPTDVEESQSSFQSSATSESVKVKKGPRLEVHQEPEGAVISADQLAEYSWGGGGPYMLQEQVAQFLGIKSFKRKYPGIHRHSLDMQERDFIRESGLASEAMCDLGLTAVNSADILDIMYSDFQPKYEEYCKHQRDRQAKDLTNKQKALSIAASQEKNKLDITEQAVQSAATWNSAFNKARREQRKACMDLQTFTINYPKTEVKEMKKAAVGNYPVALVSGQFTDYYKIFTPTELNNLPLNTMCYNTISVQHHDNDDSQSDGSGSDSDTSSSDSDSSDSGSSDNCTVCSSAPAKKQLAIH